MVFGASSSLLIAFKADLVTHVPAHAQDDDFAVEVPPVEQPVDGSQRTHCGLALVKNPSITHRPPRFAPEPLGERMRKCGSRRRKDKPSKSFFNPKKIFGYKQADRHLREAGITAYERFELSSPVAIAVMVESAPKRGAKIRTSRERSMSHLQCAHVCRSACTRAVGPLRVATRRATGALSNCQSASRRTCHSVTSSSFSRMQMHACASKSRGTWGTPCVSTAGRRAGRSQASDHSVQLNNRFPGI